MSLLNFVDLLGPPVPASYLNALDLIRQVMSATPSGNISVGPPTAGIPFTVVALAGARPVSFISPNVAGQSFGPLIIAGTNAADNAITINNALGTITFFQIQGDGSISATGNMNFGSRASPLITSTAPGQHGWVQYVDGSTVAGLATQGVAIGNVSADPLAVNFAIEIANNITGHELVIGTTSTTRVVAALANAPAGPAHFFYSPGVTHQLLFGVGTAAAFGITTANTLFGIGPQAAVAVDMTPDAGMFVGVLTGFAAGQNINVSWKRIGPFALLSSDAGASAVSTTTALTMTGIPNFLVPSAARVVMTEVLDNSGGKAAAVSVTLTNTLVFSMQSLATGLFGATNFTAAGNKGLGPGWSVLYPLI